MVSGIFCQAPASRSVSWSHQKVPTDIVKHQAGLRFLPQIVLTCSVQGSINGWQYSGHAWETITKFARGWAMPAQCFLASSNCQTPWITGSTLFQRSYHIEWCTYQNWCYRKANVTSPQMHLWSKIENNKEEGKGEWPRAGHRPSRSLKNSAGSSPPWVTAGVGLSVETSKQKVKTSKNPFAFYYHSVLTILNTILPPPIILPEKHLLLVVKF